MRTIPVTLGDRSYSIYIKDNILGRLGDLLQGLPLGKRVLLVTDTNVGRLYGTKVADILHQSGFQACLVEIPAGEGAKSLEHAAKLYDSAFACGLDRSCPVLALGGGVVGDLAGFVASTFMRGVPFIQVPTTLLSQVDSSVGGKVAVNHPRGKNIIGAFYQPRMVLIDVSTLRTLNDREIRAGLAEVIKYGIIWDSQFFSWLEKNIDPLLNLEAGALEYVIETCCRIKAEVVEQDETEQGRRAVLNYGHTVGHAVELLEGYGTYLHGEAVAIGMAAEARLALNLGLLSVEEAERIDNIIKACGLPVEIPRGLQPEPMIKSMYTDKKVTGGRLTFALPRGIGQSEVFKGISEAQIEKILI